MLHGGHWQKKIVDWISDLFPDNPILTATTTDRLRSTVLTIHTRALQLVKGPKEVIVRILDDSDSGKEEKDKIPTTDYAKRSAPIVELDKWLTFHMDNQQTASLAVQLRLKWHSLFMSRMKNPSRPWSQSDEAVLQLMIMILGNAEKQLGLDNPVGVGQRPRQIETTYGGNLEEYYRQQGNIGVHQHQQRQHQQFHPHHPQHQHFPRGPNPQRPYSGQQRKPPAQNYTKTAAPQQTKGNGGSLRSVPTEMPKSSSPGLSQFVTPTSSSGHSGDRDMSSGGNCCFFVMKCNNQRNLDMSQRKSLWATSTSNEAKLNKAFQSSKAVFLIFSVQGSGHFQGFAKMTSSIGKEKSPDFMAPGLSGIFSVEWHKRANLPFQMTQHLLNPWNEDRKVQISRDGQEIEPSVGASLLKLWDSHPSLSRRPQSGFKQQQKVGPSSHRHRNPPQQHQQHGAKREQDANSASDEKHQHSLSASSSEFQDKNVPSSSSSRSQGTSNASGIMAAGGGNASGLDPSKPNSSSVMILQRTSHSPS